MLPTKSEAGTVDDPLMQRQHELHALRGYMTELQQLIHTEYDALTQQWTEFETKRDELVRTYNKLNSVGKDDDRLRINVGGDKFEVRESCTRVNTYFRALFSRTFTAPDADGYFYIDRDPEMVPFILNFYRRTQSAVDTQTRLSALPDAQLEILSDDCDFYMATELQAHVAHQLELRGSAHRILHVPFNVTVGTERCNGLVFELNVTLKGAKLMGLRIATAEPTTRVVAELHYRVGGLNSTTPLRKIATAELLIEPGELGGFPFSSIALAEGLHTFAVYSPTGKQPLVAAPRADSTRAFKWCSLEKTRHINGVRGLQHVSGEDALDFVGNMTVSFQGSR